VKDLLFQSWAKRNLSQDGEIAKGIFKDVWDAAWDQALANSIPFTYKLSYDMTDTFKHIYGDPIELPAFWSVWHKSWLMGSQTAAQRCLDLINDDKDSASDLILDEFGLNDETTLPKAST